MKATTMVASHADILLARHVISPPQLTGEECVTSLKNVCEGGYDNRGSVAHEWFIIVKLFKGAL